jgi:CDGSH iron-sulfur domain-containing protein 3
MSTVKPNGAPAGPIVVTVEADKTYWWCACGLSRKQPFCDGSHKGTDVVPLRFKPDQAGPTRFCVCKQTRTPPFCDRALASCAGE